MGVHLRIVFLINEVAVSSKVVGDFTAMKWSIGCRQRLKKLSGGFRLQMLFVL